MRLVTRRRSRQHSFKHTHFLTDHPSMSIIVCGSDTFEMRGCRILSQMVAQQNYLHFGLHGYQMPHTQAREWLIERAERGEGGKGLQTWEEYVLIYSWHARAMRVKLAMAYHRPCVMYVEGNFHSRSGWISLKKKKKKRTSLVKLEMGGPPKNITMWISHDSGFFRLLECGAFISLLGAKAWNLEVAR